MDPIAGFKKGQRESWSTFAPFEVLTTVAAARLVSFAGITHGQRVLDVACGTGVVAVTAARRGADVTGLDLTPELLSRAAENAAIADVRVEWKEGDVESLPWEAGSFDVVVSQFGHMFAPRPEVAVAEMLRVLKPGGIIAFSTWPPELFVGRLFSVLAKYLPPPPEGVAPPPLWGDVRVVQERLGKAVRDLRFDRGVMPVQALSPAHFRLFSEKFAGPVTRAVVALEREPDRLAALRAELDELASQYFAENVLRQDFLMTRALKA